MYISDMFSIKNNVLIASINLKGAELTSLKKKNKSQEYIWQADPTFWPRHAPILFPIVGKLRNDEYLYEGKKYSLSQHGFARDLPFILTEKGEDWATLYLEDSTESRMIYPFKFKLEVKYQLIENSLHSTITVSNKGKKLLPFSLGIHPGFSIHATNAAEREKYSLLFEKIETSPRYLLSNGLRNGEISSSFNTQEIFLTKGLFDHDALIFKGLSSKQISLCHEGKKVISLKAADWPWYGIWSKNDNSPFVCLEPWYGVADSYDFQGEIIAKEGIQLLNPSDSFQCQYEITLE